MSNQAKKSISLSGQKAAVWERPGHLSNSQITLTTRRLSQKSLYSAYNLRHLGSNNVINRSLDSDGLTDSAAEMDYKKSVSFTGPSGTISLSNGRVANGNMNGEVSSNTGSDVSTGSGSKPRSGKRWYTRSLHAMGPSDLQNGGYNSSQGAMINSHTDNAEQTTTNNINPTVSNNINGHSSDSDKLNGHTPGMTEKQLKSGSRSSMDHLARNFFPVTLGAAYYLGSIDPNKIPTSSPPAQGMPKPNSQPWRPKSSKSPSRRNRPGSGHSSSSSASKGSVDKMYFRTAEAPNTASSTVLLSSPFQSELAQLRMERLRIEEEHLLEVKRQDELEKIRGPQPKWYEMKTPRFHYEAHKNTELLRKSKDYQELLDYRNELESASREFHEHYTATS